MWQNNKYIEAFAGITIVYALSPIDFIPDFIPVIGLLDDLILFPIFVGITIKLIPIEIFNQCRAEAKTLWKDGKAKRWYFEIPIILLWIIIVFMIIKLVITNLMN